MPIYQMPDGSHADIPEDADPILLKKLWDSYQPAQVARDQPSIDASIEKQFMSVAGPVDTGLRKGLLFGPTLGWDTGKTMGKVLKVQIKHLLILMLLSMLRILHSYSKRKETVY